MSCDGPFIRSFEQEILPEYTGSMTWEKVTAKASFSRRYDHASTVYNNKIWVFGGYDSTRRGNQDTYMEDVWSSSDGEHWTLVTDTAQWKGRRGHAAVTFDGAMYIIGGFVVDEETKERGYKNDVYMSLDGVRWTLIADTNDWGPRMNHSVVVSGNKMYLFGGFQNGITYFDDMWESSDGVSWTQVSQGSLPGKRSSFGTAVDNSGTIYLLGGSYEGAKPYNNGGIDSSFGPGWAALWSYDPNEIAPTWSRLSAPRWGTSLKAEFSLGYLDDKLILLPGKANTSNRFSRNNTMYSTEMFDFSSWYTDSIGPPIPPRYSYSSVVFKDSLFVIGGLGDNGPMNDVYKGSFGDAL